MSNGRRRQPVQGSVRAQIAAPDICVEFFDGFAWAFLELLHIGVGESPAEALRAGGYEVDELAADHDDVVPVRRAAKAVA